MGNKRIYSAEVILGGILLLGTVLRFYRFGSIPLTNDELSALYRLNYSSFSELIRSGIMIDGHPALIQTFLYYYTHLFGTEAWVVKLPFACCGIASLFVVYQIGRLLINKNLGLAVAAFMATSQFFVMYSQVARPYAPGLLFVLLLAWKGLHILLSDKRTLIHYVLFALLLWLAASTHYFSALTAGIITMIILGFEQKGHRKKMGVAVSIALLAYTPQLPILLNHLQTGGIGGASGWLPAPSFRFMLNFFAYLFQYSLPSYLFICCAFAVTIFKLMKASVKEFFILSSLLLIFVLVFLTGFLYSVYRNPVLQHSALIFATPFLLFVTFYGISKLRPRYAILSVLLLLIVNTVALTRNRQHYALFYHQGYMAATAEAGKFKHAHWIFVGNSPQYFDYYMQQQEIQHAFDFSIPGSNGDDAFRKRLSEIREDTLVLAFGTPGHLGLLAHSLAFFPYIAHHAGGAAFDVYVLTKEKPTSMPEFLFYVSDTTFRPFVQISGNDEYSKSVTINLDSLQVPDAAMLDIISTVSIPRTSQANPILVIALNDLDDNPVAWYGQEFRQMVQPNDTFAKLRMLIRLNDFPSSQPLKVKAYIWNKDKVNFAATLPHIQIYKGNAYLYGLMDKVPVQ